MSEKTPGKEHMSARGAQGAAIRWEERHPDAEIEHAPPAAPAAPALEGVPNRHSASAEAAALRLNERMEEDSEQARRGAQAEGQRGSSPRRSG